MTSTLDPAKPRRRRIHKPKLSTRRVIGSINIAEVVVGLPCLIAAYGLAEHLVVAQEAAAPGQVASQSVNFWPADLAITLNMSLLIVGAAAGAVGSVIQQSMAFARTNGATGQRSVLLYILRPLWSAVLGSISVIAVNTGLISIGDETTSSAGVALLVLTGCLAGLFTNRFLARLRRMLDPAARGRSRR